MSRTCGNCRWWRRAHAESSYGYCHRHPPVYMQIASVRPETGPDATCGEWADAATTPEQDNRRELVRRFAAAVVQGQYANDDYREGPQRIWLRAIAMADAEPDLVTKQIS